jgi:hypothetical protein
LTGGPTRRRWRATGKDEHCECKKIRTAVSERTGALLRLRGSHRMAILPGAVDSPRVGRRVSNLLIVPVDLDDGTSGWGPLRWQTHSCSRAQEGDDFRTIGIGVSYWLLAGLLLLPPTLWTKRARVARRARRLGLCPTCGYDTRATPDRCPECGTGLTRAISA